jgi:3-oxoacyl-[acyl-carrier protein] reductase
MKELAGKVAIVTGASKGIGAGIAKGLAEAEASVVVNYASSREGADRVVAEIENAGGKTIAVQADISNIADVEKLFDKTVSVFGRLDVLVNNASVFSHAAIEDITEEQFHQMFNINVLGTIFVTQQAVKHFGDQGGSIINIGSLSSRRFKAGAAVYTATKSALNGITGVFAVELASRKIRVNAILPGFVDTEGSRAFGVMGTEWEKQLIAATPLGRVGLPSDLAPVAVFLASDASAWLTGELIAASGGMQ